MKNDWVIAPIMEACGGTLCVQVEVRTGDNPNYDRCQYVSYSGAKVDWTPVEGAPNGMLIIERGATLVLYTGSKTPCSQGADVTPDGSEETGNSDGSTTTTPDVAPSTTPPDVVPSTPQPTIPEATLPPLGTNVPTS
ncbi:hypothetical protein IU450_28060 [Nocardia abscessus]|uniref:hypothetical protein n=1 Tax=Nocardia abscessus TaxID=120957 RepID=UPI001895A0D2|nr:hypothetical protein [Nocardia abscessus]MBF6339717.1 hypothetical protein [Nocardia abscessus]